MTRISEMGLGRFRISRPLVEQEPDTAMRIMAQCVILRCELLYHVDAFEYVAYSSQFTPAVGNPERPAQIHDYQWTYNSVANVLSAQKVEGGL